MFGIDFAANICGMPNEYALRIATSGPFQFPVEGWMAQGLEAGGLQSVYPVNLKPCTPDPDCGPFRVDPQILYGWLSKLWSLLGSLL